MRLGRAGGPAPIEARAIRPAIRVRAHERPIGAVVNDDQQRRSALRVRRRTGAGRKGRAPEFEVAGGIGGTGGARNRRAVLRACGAFGRRFVDLYLGTGERFAVGEPRGSDDSGVWEPLREDSDVGQLHEAAERRILPASRRLHCLGGDPVREHPRRAAELPAERDRRIDRGVETFWRGVPAPAAAWREKRVGVVFVVGDQFLRLNGSVTGLIRAVGKVGRFDVQLQIRIGGEDVQSARCPNVGDEVARIERRSRRFVEILPESIFERRSDRQRVMRPRIENVRIDPNSRISVVHRSYGEAGIGTGRDRHGLLCAGRVEAVRKVENGRAARKSVASVAHGSA